MLRWAALLVLLAWPAFGQAHSNPTLDSLLTALRNAPSEEAAAALEAQVRAQWIEAANWGTGSPTMPRTVSTRRSTLIRT